MKRALPWLICLIAVAAVVTPMAQGTAGAKDPRVAGLIKKVNALQSRVNGLQTQVAELKTQSDTLTARSDCFAAQGVVLRGTGANEGYLYKRATGSDLWLYSALDLPDQGEAPQTFLATVKATCVTSSFKARAGGMKSRTPSAAHLAPLAR